MPGGGDAAAGPLGGRTLGADRAGRPDPAGQDGVDGDGMSGQFHRAGAAERQQRALGPYIGREPPDHLAGQAGRCDIDDPPARARDDHRPRDLSRHQTGATPVHDIHPVPFRRRAVEQR
jgi:hypothetical protein